MQWTSYSSRFYSVPNADSHTGHKVCQKCFQTVLLHCCSTTVRNYYENVCWGCKQVIATRSWCKGALCGRVRATVWCMGAWLSRAPTEFNPCPDLPSEACATTLATAPHLQILPTLAVKSALHRGHSVLIHQKSSMWYTMNKQFKKNYNSTTNGCTFQPITSNQCKNSQ